MSESMRAFVAFDLDADSVARFTALAERLRASRPPRLKASFVTPDRMHVTVKFLGPTRLDLAAPLGEAVRACAARAPLVTRPRPIDAFGSPKRAHVIIVPLADPDGALADIAEAIEARAQPLGFARETRAYRPHVTLARLRETADVRDWLELAGAVPDDDVRLTDLTLYRSDGRAPDIVYTPIARTAFTA